VRNVELKKAPCAFGCKLFVGDRVKFGRQEFKILEIQGPFKKEPLLLHGLYVILFYLYKSDL